MLHDKPAMLTFSVDSLDKAKDFYGQVLGLEVDDSQGMLQVKMNGLEAWLYEKKDHQPATYTLLNFTVDDLDAKMKEMRDAGITFEQYDDPKTDEHGVADYGMMRIAFFNDPAGNNHAVLQMVKE
ncbi:MAG TPA: VOC family protein [Candidatus Saccharimonadales bacterium]|nr:VOC family protein [Candidatus Saccharimonadales bacterium]